jgi:hypothetical protein
MRCVSRHSRLCLCLLDHSGGCTRGYITENTVAASAAAVHRQACCGVARCQEAQCLQWVSSNSPGTDHLNEAAEELLGKLGVDAVAADDVGKSWCLAAALRELSAGLCKGDYQLHRARHCWPGPCRAFVWKQIGQMRPCITNGQRLLAHKAPLVTHILVMLCVLRVDVLARRSLL